MASYILRCLRRGGGGEESELSSHKKCLSFCGGGGGGRAPHTPLLIHFQFLFLSTLLSFRLLTTVQEFVIFFNGDLNLSANLFIGFMVLAQTVQ